MKSKAFGGAGGSGPASCAARGGGGAVSASHRALRQGYVAGRRPAAAARRP